MHRQISIHALREEGDAIFVDVHQYEEISIHALREEGDTESVDATVEAIKFLSTPSARRATAKTPSSPKLWRISIHALREEGDHSGQGNGCRCNNFYPRPPRGGRLNGSGSIDVGGIFLSTPSARRATTPGAHGKSAPGISIHALREEGDAGQR